jgi:hypothetical protein
MGAAIFLWILGALFIIAAFFVLPAWWSRPATARAGAGYSGSDYTGRATTEPRTDYRQTDRQAGYPPEDDGGNRAV